MILKLKSVFKTHYFIIFFALFMGLVSSLPQYFNARAIPNFQGIYEQMTDDVNYYKVRAKEVIDGHPTLINPYIFEHKDGSSVQFWVPDFILAKPIGWFGLSVSEGFIFWNSILIPIIILLSYYLFLLITKSKFWSFLAMIFFYSGIYSTEFLRLPSPGLNFIFFLCALLFVFLFIREQKNSYAIMSAISFGLLFHIYPWYWTYFIVLFGVFLATSYILKLKDFSYKKYLYVILGGLIIGIPYFLSVWRSSQLPGYGETLARTGLINTHFPSGIFSVAVISIIILVSAVFYIKKVIKIDKTSIFVFCCLISGIIATNSHIITGKNLEFSSHYLLGNMFVSLLAFVYLLSIYLKDKSEKIKKTFMLLFSICVLVLMFTGISRLVAQETSSSQNVSYIQNYAPVFDWLNNNAENDQVVYSNDQINSLIPIYTSQNVYFSPYSLIFLMTNDEVEKRFIISHYFEDFTYEYILSKYRSVFGTFYLNEHAHNRSKNKLRKFFGIAPVSYVEYPSEEIERIIEKAKLLQSDSFENQIKTYQVDYLVWDKNKNPDWKLSRFKFLSQVFSEGDIIVYKVN